MQLDPTIFLQTATVNELRGVLSCWWALAWRRQNACQYQCHCHMLQLTAMRSRVLTTCEPPWAIGCMQVQTRVREPSRLLHERISHLAIRLRNEEVGADRTVTRTQLIQLRLKPLHLKCRNGGPCVDPKRRGLCIWLPASWAVSQLLRKCSNCCCVIRAVRRTLHAGEHAADQLLSHAGVAQPLQGVKAGGGESHMRCA